MIQILFIVPYPELRETIAAVLERYPRRSELITRIVEATVDQVDAVNIDPCDVIVARGYSARKLKSEQSGVPVIEIEISGYDVIASMRECFQRFHARRIAFIGFYNAFNGIKNFAGMFGCDIHLYIPGDPGELNAMLRRAREDGCDAIIGGYSAHALALESGLDSIALRSGEESVGLALEEAVRAVELLRQERIRTETYRAITQAAKESIILVDAGGVIQVDNRAANAFAGCELKGRPLRDVFPQLAGHFEEVLNSGREILDRLCQVVGVGISLDCTPVVAGGQSLSVVMSFQSVRRVQQLEGHIRRQLHEKGLVAKYHFSDIVHRSKAVSDVIGIARRYALLPFNILIDGETGTGKELFAHSIHNESPLRDGPFVAVNCAALPESLLESELFGYVDGAFTGTAKGGKAGLFELAHGGTLFLDEIAEIPVGLQSKLLRVLQEKEVRRIGADKIIAVDVRIISATNGDLDDLVRQGRFRRDLFYRLNVFNISLPPLRGRREDVAELFHYFLESTCRRYSTPAPQVEPAALEVLLQCEFNGNVRELRNIVARVCALRSDLCLLTTEDMRRALPSSGVGEETAPPSERHGAGSMPSHKDAERQRTLQTLGACQGDKGKAARALGINRSTLWRRLRSYRDSS
jgi:transcriptional regulator with PAS, ATPase and Fis domain